MADNTVAPAGHIDRWDVLKWRLQEEAPTRSDPVSLQEFSKWDSASKMAFDERRLEGIANSVVLKTPQLKELTVEYRRAALFAGRPIGRTGILLSGPATMGKTTAAMHVMREAFQRHAKRYPDWESLEHVPVVYVEIPSRCTAKDLMGRLLAFFGLPVLPRTTLEERTRLATMHLIRARTGLVVFDEIHNLTNIGVTQFESAQAIKNLMNAVPAVPIYVGLDLEKKAITNSELGAQFAARCTLVRLGRYEIETEAGVKLWNSIIVAFEKRHHLFAHDPGTLLPLNRWLWDQTRGSIGTLSRLLDLAAFELIAAEAPSGETITKELLKGIAVDLTSQRELDLAADATPSPSRKRRSHAA